MSDIAAEAAIAPVTALVVGAKARVAPVVAESDPIVASAPTAAAAPQAVVFLRAPNKVAAQGDQLSEGMPPYVVRGISIAGKWRYGVKIKMPGRRQQVRRPARLRFLPPPAPPSPAPSPALSSCPPPHPIPPSFRLP